MRKVDKDGFVILDEPKIQSLCVLAGSGGTGKTEFVTHHCPDPVIIIGYDGRSERRVLEARALGRDVKLMQVDYPSNVAGMTSIEVKRSSVIARKQMDEYYQTALRFNKEGRCRTIAFDTITEGEAIVTLSVRGRMGVNEKDHGTSKGEINRHLLSMAMDARNSTAHVVFLSRAADEWLGGEATGNQTHKAPMAIYDAVDWAGVIRHEYDRKEKKRKFKIRIIKGGDAAQTVGEEYTEDDWNDLGGPFAYTCFMQYPGTDFTDWG